MEIPNTHIDLIERYLSQKMSEVERTDFETRLTQEKDLAQNLADFKEAREAIDLYTEERLKSQFRERYLAEKASETVMKPLGARRWMYAVAAAVVLLVAVLIGNRLLNPSLSPEQLYAQNYQMPPLNVRGESDDPLEVISLKMDQADFETAIVDLQTLLGDSSFQRQPAAWLRMGLSYMELQKWPLASDALEQVDPSSPLVHQARWYAALTALQRGQIEDAKSLLAQILAESRDVELKDQAQKLLDQL
ncbi:MAG: tetratricopeptide repeat protein [Bacteroidota bacterium]